MPEFLFCSVVLNLVEASLLEVILLVLVGYHSHHAAWISHSHHIVGDILRHDAAGAYDYVVSDMHSGIYHAVRAYPHVIAYRNGLWRRTDGGQCSSDCTESSGKLEQACFSAGMAGTDT